MASTARPRGLPGLQPQRPGPKSPSADQRTIEQQRKRIEKLEKELRIAQKVVELQRILTARESELVALAPTPTLSTAPTVNLPGLAKAPGAARDHAITI
ncbi:MAG: hypothetical protein AB7K71_11985 [Polyangiaceae bacterium]